jgi:hypothetical protein
LDVRVHIASYKLIFFFNNGNILSACCDLGFAVEIDIAFANSGFPDVSTKFSLDSEKYTNFPRNAGKETLDMIT